MYLPEYFKEKDYEELVKVVTHFPLAALVCDSDGEIVVNHIPLIFENLHWIKVFNPIVGKSILRSCFFFGNLTKTP